MEEKKKTLKGIEKMSSLLNKAKEGVVKFADQNDDGKINLSDVSKVADNIGQAAKSTASMIKDNLEEKNRELEKKLLQPIFSEDLNNADFFMSKLIRITEKDKKHAESEVCKGAIGYIVPSKELKVVNIFADKVDAFGLSFYPDKASEIYYVDPTNSDRYIALDDYFNYMKVARVTELQKIAQDLGAKHFKVTYKEQKASFSKQSAKADVHANSQIDAERELEASDIAFAQIAAESSFAGHDPIEPTLQYLQRDPSILSLIALRMDKNAPLSHQKYTLKLSNSSGIKEKDALKIDVALKAMKVSGNTTVASEARNEDRKFFEYEIDF